MLPLRVGNESDLFIVFRFDSGTRVPLIAPADGALSSGYMCPEAMQVLQFSTRTQYWAFWGHLDLSGLTESGAKAGRPMGYVTGGDTQASGSFDLIFTITTAGPSGTTMVKEDELQRLFPVAFEKPTVSGPVEWPRCALIQYLGPDHARPGSKYADPP